VFLNYYVLSPVLVCYDVSLGNLRVVPTCRDSTKSHNTWKIHNYLPPKPLILIFMYLDQTTHTHYPQYFFLEISQFIWNLFTANWAITMQFYNNLMLHKCKYSIWKSVWREMYFFFSQGSTALARLCLLHEVPRSYVDTPHPLGRAPLDKWSDRRNGICLTTHNIHKRQTAGSNPQPQAASGRRHTP